MLLDRVTHSANTPNLSGTCFCKGAVTLTFAADKRRGGVGGVSKSGAESVTDWVWLTAPLVDGVARAILIVVLFIPDPREQTVRGRGGFASGELDYFKRGFSILANQGDAAYGIG